MKRDINILQLSCIAGLVFSSTHSHNYNNAHYMRPYTEHSALSPFCRQKLCEHSSGQGTESEQNIGVSVHLELHYTHETIM